MSKRLFFVAVAFVGTAISDVTAVQHSTPAPDRVQGAPNVIAARHDRSARLRDIPPGPPLPLDRTEREPQMHRVVRHLSALTPDPVVQSTPAVTSVPGPTRSVEGVGNV